MKSLILTIVAAAAAAFGVTGQVLTEERATNRVVIYHKDGSRVCYDFDDVSRIEHEVTYDGEDVLTCGKAYEDITDKSRWKIVYGSVAMPFGPFSQMIDGKEDGGGWMGFIDDGCVNSPNLGKPFAVVDLGENVPLSAIGIQAGDITNNGAYDVMPAKVDFYITDRDDVSVELADSEKNLMNGSEGDNHDKYLSLHRKLREADSRMGWVKIGSVIVGAPESSHVAKYYYTLNNIQLLDGVSARFIKLEVTPFSGAIRTGDRTKICELLVRRVAE